MAVEHVLRKKRMMMASPSPALEGGLYVLFLFLFAQRARTLVALLIIFRVASAGCHARMPAETVARSRPHARSAESLERVREGRICNARCRG